MASIPLNYHQLTQRYAQQRDEVMIQIQDSRSRHRNVAPEDMTWTIEYVTVIRNGLMTFNDLANDLLNAAPRRPAPQPEYHFSIQGRYRDLSRSVRLRQTPIEFTNQQQEHRDMQDNLQHRLNNSLQEANANPNRLWLRLNGPFAQGRVMLAGRLPGMVRDHQRDLPQILAFPILAALKTGRNNSVIIVTDNYEGSHSVFKLHQMSAMWEDKRHSERMIDFFENGVEDERRVIGRKTYRVMGEAEIRQLTDFLVYREEIDDLIRDIEDAMGNRPLMGAPEAFDDIPDDEE